MRFIFKIILFSSLLFSALLSNTNIDECKSDLYYANGIMLDMEISIDKHEEKWKDKVDDIFLLNPEELAKLSKIKISYNASQGFFDDIFESAEQVMSNEWGWNEFSGYFRTYLELKGYQDSVDQHRPNLTTQVEAYKQSIKDGHGVIVIAHSQGNYYTNEAYEELDAWMKDYFHMMGVATPANHVAGYAVSDTTAPYVKFHNDMINVVATGLPSNRDDSHHQGFPSYDAHDFYDSYLTNTETRNDIFNFILEKIQAHGNAPSQWQTDQELNKDTKDYKITVKHRFDSSVVMSEEVYPFAASKKLYYVTDNTGGNGWVKASCGGSEVFDDWTDKQSNQFYKLEGTDPLEYISVIKYTYSNWIVDNNANREYILSIGNYDYSTGTEDIIAGGEQLEAKLGTYPTDCINSNSLIVEAFFDIVAAQYVDVNKFTVIGEEGAEGNNFIPTKEFYTKWGYLLLPTEYISEYKTIEHRWFGGWSAWGCGTDMGYVYARREYRVKTLSQF